MEWRKLVSSGAEQEQVAGCFGKVMNFRVGKNAWDLLNN
jgi:hypothetical protein